MTRTDSTLVRRAVKAFAKANVLVIGDIIMDHFIWGTVSRISPEAPVPVVNVTHENLLLGGAANVLNNITALGGSGTLCGVIGHDAMGDHLIKLIDELPAPSAGVIRSSERPTTIKTRIIAQHQQVVRFDREKTGAINQECLDEVLHFIARNIKDFNAVIVSDYNKGMITQSLMDGLRSALPPAKKIPVIVDPKPDRPQRFAGTTIITPNHHEAQQISGMTIDSEKTLLAAARAMQQKLALQAVLITRGEAGMALYEKGKPLFTIPTVAREVFDVTGAGDTVIATLTLGLAIGLSFAEAATIANIAAGIVVGKLGTGTVTTQELLEAVE